MILCCGEALIDMIPTPTNTQRDGFVPHTGGAIFNTAVALGRLGTEVAMLTGLSTDMFGQQLKADLEASKVDTHLVIKAARPTTLAFVQLRDGHATYDFYDENSAGRMLQPHDMPDLTDEIDTLYFGGISLACEPGADAYADLLQRNGDTRAVMIDPNIRPGFIQDEARYRTRLDKMLAKCDIIKVSDEDLDWIVPGDAGLDAKVATLLNRGAAMIIVTRGGDGASGYLADGSQVSVPVEKVQVVDTVGAGDTFNAGVLAKLSELGLLSKAALKGMTGDQAKAALAHGAKVAAVTVSRAGANPPWAHELS
ncbi:carbohydrate kinase [uncultured Pelagimonas sp.]|uniref:carbohydrate kinase family protein n=1 Tax=uncultured Pelagimonas sp. TaxID=1618102 RepID=UPI0026178244|nr:carbohydrate kinase [uncultured Pelagimonas sp.]